MANFLSNLRSRFGSTDARRHEEELQAPEDPRIPYQVYQTIHQPARRQQWVLYIGVALLLVVLAVTLAGRLSRNRDDRSAKTPFEQVQQTPGSVERSKTTPVTTPVSAGTSDAIVKQPQ